MNCDIIIPVWNQKSLTKDCVESILANTSAGYRIVIIDNGSEQDTRDYLESIRCGNPGMVVIRNDKNVGFVKAANQGMRASIAPFVCLLNNDTITTKGWLEEMVSIAESSKDIGIVNPSSNNLGQKPAEGEPIGSYAARLGSQHGMWTELGAAIGFCMLIKREVIEAVGLFDEIYGMGNFEDTDYSRKAVMAGYKCVRACGAYVYHRENSSFGKLKNFDYDFKRNKEIFEFRWGKPKRIAYIIADPDKNDIKRIGADSVKSARSGNRIWFYSKDKLQLPEHSNIMKVELGDKHFFVRSIFNVIKKKKKFDEILVSDARLAKALEASRFFHNARVVYY